MYNSEARTTAACGVSGLMVALVITSIARAGGADDGNAGMKALNRGDYDHAISLFTRALASSDLSPDDREFAFSERGTAYLDKGDYQSALADLRRAIQLKPDDADAQRQLELALSHVVGSSPQSDRDNGYANRDDLGATTKDSAAQAGLDANAGMTAASHGDYAQAVLLFGRAIDSAKLGPDDLELAYLSRGKAYLERGDNSRGIADLNKAVQMNASDQEAQAAFNKAMLGLHARIPVTPIDAATCASNYSSTGSWVSAKSYQMWASYATVSPLDAFAGAYMFLVDNQWTISRLDLNQGIISAKHEVPNDITPTALEIKIEPAGDGSKTTLTEVVYFWGAMSTAKSDLCGILGEVARG